MCVSSLHVLSAFSLYRMCVKNVQYPFSYEIEPAIPSLQLKLTQRLLRAQKVAESLAVRERQSDCTQSTHFTLIYAKMRTSYHNCTHTHVQTCAHVNTHKQTHIFTHTYTHTHTHTYVHVHTHMFTNMHRKKSLSGWRWSTVTWTHT